MKKIKFQPNIYGQRLICFLITILTKVFVS